MCRFLAIPDALAAGPIIYQMTSYLGAFPFPSLAPAILTRGALIKVVVVMTQRYGKVLKRGGKDRNKLLFRSLAVFDRRLSSIASPKLPADVQALRDEKAEKAIGVESAIDGVYSLAQGFSTDEPVGGEEDDEDDDELALAALDSLDAIEVYNMDRHSETKMQQAQIPADNFRKLLMLLLIIAALESHENLPKVAEYLVESRLSAIQKAADSILWSFKPEDSPGITYNTFNTIIHNSLPYLFDGLNPLFENFLFSKNLDLSRHRVQLGAQPASAPSMQPADVKEPLLPSEGEILTLTALSQLSFFMKSDVLFHRLHPLYSGNQSGFSINSISQKILNWRAPTIILVAGTHISDTPTGGRERNFADSLPPKRFPDGNKGNSNSSRVVFGAYLEVPWRTTHKEAIGDTNTLLFQLEPLHEVFRASSINRDYATLSKDGMGFGVPAAKKSVAGLDNHVVLGPVSLYLDENLEFGAFTHDGAGGGAFATSNVRRGDWQDRFEIESLEVWGCGGDEEAQKQREAWKWEEREAAARRGIALGRDKESDYALLEMAGLVGGHGNSGGSMG